VLASYWQEQQYRKLIRLFLRPLSVISLLTYSWPGRNGESILLQRRKATSPSIIQKGVSSLRVTVVNFIIARRVVVALHRARLVLGWVTVCGRLSHFRVHLVNNPVSSAIWMIKLYGTLTGLSESIRQVTVLRLTDKPRPYYVTCIV